MFKISFYSCDSKLKNKKNNNNMKKNKYPHSQLLRTIAFVGMSFIASFSFVVKANTITLEMSPEVTAEYKKQLALQIWPEVYKKLSFMDNPYKVFYKAMKKSLKKDAAPGQIRRLMTIEESTMAAKKKRFDYCQASIDFFVSFSQRAKALSKAEYNPLSKEQLMSGNGVDYPFTKVQKNDGNFRPAQIALDLGWKYRGKGKQHAETFLTNCLAIPVDLYYKEDKL
jgi:hypothetical protein